MRTHITTRRPVLVVLVPVVLAAMVAAHGDAVAACWRPPVDAPIVDPFREPVCRWCPGNRGIEYGTRPGQLVTAVESGRVRFAGAVAGTTYVVVEHRDRLRVTYGRLADRRVELGDVVLRGHVIGTTGAGFHFGVRRGRGDDERYVDPADSIGRLVGRPRLVPGDGSPAAAAPAPVLRCGAAVRGANAGSAR